MASKIASKVAWHIVFRQFLNSNKESWQRQKILKTNSGQIFSIFGILCVSFSCYITRHIQTHESPKKILNLDDQILSIL